MPIITVGNNTGDTYSGTDDCTLQSASTTQNDGSSSQLWVHTYGGAFNIRKTLIRFTLPGVLSGETINSAQLEINCDSFGVDGNSTGTRTIRVYRVLPAWTEAGANWETSNGSTAWASAGVNGSGTDRAASFSASVTTGATGVIVFPGMGADVAAGNATWVLEYSAVADPQDFYYHRFISSEGADGSRPRLRINYGSDASSSASESITLADAPSATRMHGKDQAESITAGESTASSISALPPGTFTSNIFARNGGQENSSSTALNYVSVRNPVTGLQLSLRTGLSTNGAGRLVFTDPVMVAGTLYLVDWLEVGGQRGWDLQVAT